MYGRRSDRTDSARGARRRTHAARTALRAALLAAAALFSAAHEARAAGGPRVPAARELDAYVRREMRRRHVPGLSLAVLRGGRVIKAKGYGLASVELGVPAGTETVYQLASATKVFTGAAVMLLAQEGRLSLEEPVTKLLPELPASWGAVTVRHCLTHTSGLPDAALSDDTDEVIAPTRAEAIRKLAALPFLFQPGEKWEYSQTGYMLLGMIIERLSGVTFEEFLARRIFRPLGMSRTSFGDSIEVVPGRSSLYTRYVLDGGKLVDAPDRRLRTTRYVYPGYLHPGAGLNSTASDMARFDAALAAGRVLKRRWLEEMWTAAKLRDGRAFRFDDSTMGYGAGWLVDDAPGHKSAGHSGGDSTIYIHYIDDRLAVVVLTNYQGAHPDEIAGGVAALYVPALAEKN
ncbi:MAG TPA: serine hydrolase domain-containing protein [Pyrinomonadaceae bacterium]|jgi:CubicO group peptidase (beta-lactamase class C family)